jgi:uncharacterized membrane protein YqjE
MSDRIRLSSTEEIPVAKLVEAALREGRELVKVEIQLAKLEAKKEVKKSVKASLGFLVAGMFAFMGFVLLIVALVLALGGTALAALGVALGALVLAVGAALLSYSLLPKEPLEHTRHHVADDLKQLKEHLT